MALPTLPTELLTADEFIDRYGHMSGVELIDGRVTWKRPPRGPELEGTMPKFRHGVYCQTAARLIDEFARPRKLGWVAANDTFVKVAGNLVRGADVLYVGFDKVPAGEPPEDLTVPPDLVIEVRSPTDRIGALSAKAATYNEAGVRVALVVDPVTQSVAVFRTDEFPVRLHNGDELTLPDVLPGFAVPVKAFFE
jgi:Uma2 family endonuclease